MNYYPLEREGRGKNIVQITLLAVLLLLPNIILGDGTTFCEYGDGASFWATINSVSQVGQDVHVRFQLLDGNGIQLCGPLSGHIILWRVNSTANKRLIDADIGSIYSGLYAPSGSCGDRNWINGKPTGCIKHPEQCDDCDGDGIPECPQLSCETYFVQVVDTCVPAGTTKYQIEGSTLGPLAECDSRTIEVTDAQQNCDPGISDALSGDPCTTSDDSGHHHDDGGCGGCEAGRGNPGLPLVALMFAIGFAALLIARKK